MAFSSVSYLREYKHTRLSKVHVSGLVSNIYNRLVKDRVSYALHNLRDNDYVNEVQLGMQSNKR